MQRIGIIDIGSNTIRLSIFEKTNINTLHILDKNKYTARLSQRLSSNNDIPIQELDDIVSTLLHYKNLCHLHHVATIHTVATAAIRNADNTQHVKQYLEMKTGLTIDVLNGQEEAMYGFIGATYYLPIQEGFFIDIGGGSSELVYFRDRKIIHSTSLPFGAVNVFKKYTHQGLMTSEQQMMLKKDLEKEFSALSWLNQHPHLPLVCIGGATRTICKIHQKQRKYPLKQKHGYEMTMTQIHELHNFITSRTEQQLSQVEGLAKDRRDLIIPGMKLFQVIYEYMQPSQLLFSEFSLRDGLAIHHFSPDYHTDDILDRCVKRLYAKIPMVPIPHVHQVEEFAMQLFNALCAEQAWGEQEKTYVHIASRLSLFGAIIDPYAPKGHTFDLLIGQSFGVLSHREWVIICLIASFQTKKKAMQYAQKYKNMLMDGDIDLVFRLGSILLMSAALDRSQKQPITSLSTQLEEQKLIVQPHSSSNWDIEHWEVNQKRKIFECIWNMEFHLKF